MSRLTVGSTPIRSTALALFTAVLLSGCGYGDKPLQAYEYAVQGLYSAAISDDSRYAVVGSIQHGGSLWDLQHNERLYNWNHQQQGFSNLVAAAFSPEGAYALTAGQQDLVLWQLNDGQSIWYWSTPDAILDAALAPDADRALVGLDNHTAIFFDIKRGGLVPRLRHQGRVQSVQISQDGDWGLTGADDNIARYWDLETGVLVSQVEHDNHVNTVALSPNGQYAFSAGQLEKALIWHTVSGELHQVLSSDERWVAQRISYTAARFSDDSRRLLTGTSSGLVQLWDVASGEELRRWQLHKREPLRPTSASVYALGFDGQGYYAIASNGFANRLQ
jgi:WD40 repeat protein